MFNFCAATKQVTDGHASNPFAVGLTMPVSSYDVVRDLQKLISQPMSEQHFETTILVHVMYILMDPDQN
jgi:hypothetical protein